MNTHALKINDNLNS